MKVTHLLLTMSLACCREYMDLHVKELKEDFGGCNMLYFFVFMDAPSEGTDRTRKAGKALQVWLLCQSGSAYIETWES